MYCKYCGNEIERGQKFCGKCGRAIDAHDTAGSTVAMHGGTSGRGNRLPRIIGACVTLAVVLVAVFSVVWNFSDKGGSFELYEQYERVEDAVASMVELYADEGGCIPPDSAQNLIDSIAGYASDSDDVTDFEVQDTGICMQLSSGLLYVYSPPIEHFLSGGNECRLVTYEPWWTDVQGVTSLHSTADVQDISDASEVDAWMNYVAEALENCSFTQRDNYNDDLVDIDALKGFGRNEFIVYYGHGGWFNKTQGSILTTGVEFSRETEERYDEDIRAGRIGCADGRLFVTPAFFDEYYGNESLSGTNVFLLACESLHDDKLAKTLVTKGADVITGFTHSVAIDYGTRMLETMLGVDARIGLTDKSSAGEYFTFSEALEMAREVNGGVDTFWDAFWPWDLAKRAECVCYPADKASTTRISASAIGKDSQNGSVMDSSGSTQDFEVSAREFVKAWYNDWTFEDGEMKINQTPHSERCLPYIAEGTELYSEFSDETNFYAGSGSRLSRGAALSVATIDTALGDDNTVTVDVAFYGAQNTITQEMFDRMKDHPVGRNTWKLAFDNSGKIIALESGEAAANGVEDEEALKKLISQSAEHEILHWFYADLDNDGDNEAFAITGIQNEHYENEWSEGEVWYADDNGAKRLGGQEAGNALNGLIEDATSGYKFLSLEHDGHGSGTTSTVFVATDGSCTEALFDLDHIGHFHEEDGRLVGYTNKWDNGFHEYEWHSFEFNPIALTFKSTGVIDVTTWR